MTGKWARLMFFTVRGRSDQYVQKGFRSSSDTLKNIIRKIVKLLSVGLPFSSVLHARKRVSFQSVVAVVVVFLFIYLFIFCSHSYYKLVIYSMGLRAVSCLLRSSSLF